MVKHINDINDIKDIEDIDYYIGKRIREKRRLRGLTQPDLGAAVGVSYQQIQKYECAEHRVAASRLWKIAQALEVKFEFFVEGFEASKGLNATISEVARRAALNNPAPKDVTVMKPQPLLLQSKIS